MATFSGSEALGQPACTAVVGFAFFRLVSWIFSTTAAELQQCAAGLGYIKMIFMQLEIRPLLLIRLQCIPVTQEPIFSFKTIVEIVFSCDNSCRCYFYGGFVVSFMQYTTHHKLRCDIIVSLKVLWRWRRVVIH